MGREVVCGATAADNIILKEAFVVCPAINWSDRQDSLIRGLAERPSSSALLPLPIFRIYYRFTTDDRSRDEPRF